MLAWNFQDESAWLYASYDHAPSCPWNGSKTVALAAYFIYSLVIESCGIMLNRPLWGGGGWPWMRPLCSRYSRYWAVKRSIRTALTVTNSWRGNVADWLLFFICCTYVSAGCSESECCRLAAAVAPITIKNVLKSHWNFVIDSTYTTTSVMPYLWITNEFHRNSWKWASPDQSNSIFYRLWWSLENIFQP